MTDRNPSNSSYSQDLNRQFEQSASDTEDPDDHVTTQWYESEAESEPIEAPYEGRLDESYELGSDEPNVDSVAKRNLNFDISVSTVASSNIEEYADRLDYSEETSVEGYWESADDKIARLGTVLDVQDQLANVEDKEEFQGINDSYPEELEQYSYNLIERYFQEQFGWEEIPVEDWPSEREVFDYINSERSDEVEFEAYVRLVLDRFPLTETDFEAVESELKEEPDFPL